MTKTVTTKQQQLDELAKQIAHDQADSQLAKGATQLVFGEGVADADVIFIGEAPGKQEDLQGRPFVGAAGKLLDAMLAEIGFDRGDVYITNIVKYRPPGNRDPAPAEITAWLPYLHQQLDIIKPKLVVTLGRFSTNIFLPEVKISQVHGKALRIKTSLQKQKKLAERQAASVRQGSGEQRTKAYEQYGEGAAQPITSHHTASGSRVDSSGFEPVATSLVVMPLYHPAVALYNSSMKQTLRDDFAKIPRVLELIKTEAKRQPSKVKESRV